jgi:IPT/TIG domain
VLLLFLTFITDSDLADIHAMMLSTTSHNKQQVTVYGGNFVNTTLLQCRFGLAAPTPAVYVNSQEIVCPAPPLTPVNGALAWSALSEQRQRLPDPLTGSSLLFPFSYHYPLYLQVCAVTVLNRAC